MPSDETREKSKAMAYFYVSRTAFFEVTKYHGIFTPLEVRFIGHIPCYTNIRKTRRYKKMTVTYFVLWLIIFEVILVGLAGLENHFRRHDRKMARKAALRRRTNP